MNPSAKCFNGALCDCFSPHWLPFTSSASVSVNLNDVRMSQGLTGHPSSWWHTHLKILKRCFKFTEVLIKEGWWWWHNYFSRGNSLFWISRAHHCGRGTFVRGDEEMEIVVFWLEKLRSRSFHWIGILGWPIEVDLPAAHLVTRPLCGWTRRRRHCCSPGLSLVLPTDTFLYMQKA